MAIINSIKNGNNIYPFSLPYGVCSTAANTVAKTVTVENFSLETGATIIVKFTYANSASSPTLNVNNTGAKPIYQYGTTTASTGTTTTGWVAGAVQMFTYDGAGWVRDYWNNTTYANGSTSTAGILQLTDSTSSTSTTTAATPNSVKSAYDLANTKLSLSGGTMTGEIAIGQGDGKGIQLGTNGRINATGKDDGSSDYTVLGMQEIVNSNDQNYLFGSTHFNLVARGKQSCPTYNGYNMVLAGTPVSGEIQVNGGDAAGGSKIVLVTGEGQITNSGTGTLFGYTASDIIAVGHSSSSLNLRGKGTRPSYNSTSSLALLSDIPTKVSELTNDSGFKTTDKYHTTGSWSGLTYTTTAKGGAEALAFTLPTGTSATTVAVGNHTHSTYANQNAFSNIKVGSTTVAADTTTDTLELVAGTNITLTPDATNDKITITATDTNTHYTTGITAGASGTTSNSALTNPYIKIKDDSTHRSQIQIKGGGATTVSSNANGVITISSTDTNTQSYAHDHSSETLKPVCVEFTGTTSSSNHGGYLDFHYNGSTSDYTSRIIESASGQLSFLASNGIVLTTGAYGTSLPAAGKAGRIFFKKV